MFSDVRFIPVQHFHRALMNRDYFLLITQLCFTTYFISVLYDTYFRILQVFLLHLLLPYKNT